MEVDVNKQSLNVQQSNMFKLDYEGQNLKNVQFIRWKNEMLKIYGKNAKLFECKNENIFFYVSEKESKTIPIYLKECPSCNKSICYFCSRVIKKDNDIGKCCIKRRINYLIYVSGFEDFDYLKSMKFILYIPFLNLLFLIHFFSSLLLYRLNDKASDNIYYPSMYQDHFKNYCLRQLTIAINIAFGTIITICFTILSLYFMSFIFVISIIFNQYPPKYIISIIYDGIMY